MIPFESIKSIFTQLSNDISLVIIRADQAGQAPGYPYGTYKNITINNESAHQNIRIASGVTVESASMAELAHYEFTDEIFSINFLDRGRIDRARDYAAQALQWFKKIEGREHCKNLGITAQLVDNQVQDRTILIETNYENKFGFDLRLEYNGAYIETIESIGTVELTPTYDGVEGTPFEVGEE